MARRAGVPDGERPDDSTCPVRPAQSSRTERAGTDTISDPSGSAEQEGLLGGSGRTRTSRPKIRENLAPPDREGTLAGSGHYARIRLASVPRDEVQYRAGIMS